MNGTAAPAAAARGFMIHERLIPVAAWSVLERGHAHEIRDHDARVHARAVLEHDWPAGEREQYVRINREHVTGHRAASSE